MVLAGVLVDHVEGLVNGRGMLSQRVQRRRPEMGHSLMPIMPPSSVPSIRCVTQ